MNIECLEIANKSTLAQIIPQKKGGVLYQLYKIDIKKPCVIGGMKEPGYCLNFAILNKKSNMVLTELNILRLLHGDCLEVNGHQWIKI